MEQPIKSIRLFDWIQLRTIRWWKLFQSHSIWTGTNGIADDFELINWSCWTVYKVNQLELIGFDWMKVSASTWCSPTSTVKCKARCRITTAPITTSRSKTVTTLTPLSSATFALIGSPTPSLVRWIALVNVLRTSHQELIHSLIDDRALRYFWICAAPEELVSDTVLPIPYCLKVS